MLTDNSSLTYVLTATKLDAISQRWVAGLSNYTSSISYKPGRNHQDVDALSRIQQPEMMEVNSQTVKGVCKGVHTSHGKVKVLSCSAQVLNHSFEDTVQPGIRTDDWTAVSSKNAVISQILEAIHSKLKLKSDMDFEL